MSSSALLNRPPLKGVASQPNELRTKLLSRQIKNTRVTLIQTLQGHKEDTGDHSYQSYVNNLVDIDVNLQMKLQFLDLGLLTKFFCQTGPVSSAISGDLLSVLEAMRALGVRLSSYTDRVPDHDRCFKWEGSATALQNSPSTMQAVAYVLKLFGFTEDSRGQHRVPSGSEPHKDTIAAITADLAITETELRLLMSGRHPNERNVLDVLSDCQTTSGVLDKMTGSAKVQNYRNFVGKSNQRESYTGAASVGGQNSINQQQTSLTKRSSVDASDASSDHRQQAPATMSQQSQSEDINHSTKQCHLCGDSDVSVMCPDCQVGRASYCQSCSNQYHAKRSSHNPQPWTTPDHSQGSTQSLLRPKPKPRRLREEDKEKRGSFVVIPGKKNLAVAPPVPTKNPWLKDRQLKKCDQSPSPNGPSLQPKPSTSTNSATDQTNPLRRKVPCPDDTDDRQYYNQDRSQIPAVRKDSVDPNGENLANFRKLQERSLEQASGGELSGSNNRSPVEVTLDGEGPFQQVIEEPPLSTSQRTALINQQDIWEQLQKDFRKRAKQTTQQGDERRDFEGTAPSDVETGPSSSVLRNRLILEGTATVATSKPTDQSGRQPVSVKSYWEEKIARDNKNSGRQTDVQHIEDTNDDDSVGSSSGYEVPDVVPPMEFATFPRYNMGQTKPPLRETQSEPLSCGKEGWPVEWACSYCSYHNERGTKVCNMCSKTNDSPKFLKDHFERQLSPSSVRGRPLPSLPQDVVSSPTSPGCSGDTAQLQMLLALRNRYGGSEQLNCSALGVHGFAEQLSNSCLSVTLSNGYTSLGTSGGTIKKDQVVKDELRSKQLLQQLKDADKESYTYEEFSLAIKLSNGRNPNEWLKTTWLERALLVQTRCNIKLKDLGHKSVQISQMEARNSLVESAGCLDDAVKKAVTLWKENFSELMANVGARSLKSREELASEVIAAMNQSRGDFPEATMILFRNNQARELSENMWRDTIPFYGNKDVASTVPGLSSSDRDYSDVMDKSVDMERRLRILMGEFGIGTRQNAHNALRIMDNNPPDNTSVSDIIEAVKNSQDIKQAMSFLRQKCRVCLEHFPAGKIIVLSVCDCKLCSSCFSKYFTMQITEKNVQDLVCPVCSRPEASDQQQFENHLQFLSLLLSNHLSHDKMELFDKKLTDWNLTQDPYFRWCCYDDCKCGFLIALDSESQKKIDCPDCQRSMCFRCKRPWKDGHSQRTCEQYLEWLLNNDPDSDYVTRLLHEKTVDCPNPDCQGRYFVGKGGCLHITCPQCKYEFCYGCLRRFQRNKEVGLHCHHPRNCAYYLRNYSLENLLKLLQERSVEYDCENPSSNMTCSVLLMTDDASEVPCGNPVERNQAGKCEDHYKEYLISLINQNGIDPVLVMTEKELKLQFTREGHPVPVKKASESLVAYKTRLVTTVQMSYKLPRLAKRNRGRATSHRAVSIFFGS